MSLDDVTSGGSYAPIVKYNAKADKWALRLSKDDEKTLDEKPVFIVDFENIQKGWVEFVEGGAPNEVLVSPDEPMPAQPGPNHKKTISVHFYSDKFFGGVAKFNPTSLNAIDGLKDVYAQYVADKKDGKLPVVAYTGAEAVKGNYGTNYKPSFKIEKWVDRPAAFDELGASNDTVAEEPAKAEATTGLSEF